MNHTCVYCGTEFPFKRKSAKFCSVKCRVRSFRHSPGVSEIPKVKPQPKTIKKITEKNEPKLDQFVQQVQSDKQLKLCQHGRMLGLCEYGCT